MIWYDSGNDLFFREQLQEQYRGRIERELSGQVYVIVSKIFRVLIDQKITVPGSFVGYV
jgi:structure-specific recognition protein 1